MSFRLVTFWSGELYGKWAAQLETSCQKTGTPIVVYAADDKGDWLANEQRKVEFIRQAAEEFPKEDLIWVDADCTVHQFPELFNNLGHVLVSMYLSMSAKGPVQNGSVIYFSNRKHPEHVAKVLDSWEKQLKDNPECYDDKALVDCKDTPELTMLSIQRLPPEYCWHERNMRARFPKAKPVIECHMVHSKPDRVRLHIS